MATKPPLITISGKRSSYSFYPVSGPNNDMQGGMGRVFKGIDNQSKAPVAIKAIFSQLASKPTIRERAELEGHLHFKHPNLIEMLDFCVTKEGKIHVVSTFIPGENIDVHVMALSSKLSVPQKQAFVWLKAQAILDALSFIHQEGITHRDIKPDNIKIGLNDTPILMDLGVAKASNGKSLTSVGVVIGTPHYSAPEQIKGESSKINATTDIYALGITLYELLTGTLPFNGVSQYDIMEKQVKKPLPPHPALSPKAFAVLKKATEKEQHKRFQSAAEFKLAIQRISNTPSAWQRMAAYFNQHIK